ncbi:MAG: tRNA lysidine(34) synthetase TilS, partial [Thermoleophilia bacterium]|nr:tRNA lysidine(34) synthetase TilS [Thermoleophilia bacterium]
DSSALVIALAAAAGRNAPTLLTVAHILHDLRPPADARADRDRAAALAAALGLPFVDDAVHVAALPGNAEANARRERYRALTRLAALHHIPFIATAHHSHDQAESVLMNLLRGSGPRGLSGTAAARPLAPGVTLIRPMLTVPPHEARDLCTRAGWSYAADATNADTTRLRNAVRADILPRLLALRPGAEQRIARAAERCREADRAISRAARGLLRAGRTTDGYAWPRDRLRAAPPAVLTQALRTAALKLAQPARTDRLPARTLTQAASLIASAQTDPKRLDWPGVTLEITSRSVTARRS